MSSSFLRPLRSIFRPTVLYFWAASTWRAPLPFDAIATLSALCGESTGGISGTATVLFWSQSRYVRTLPSGPIFHISARHICASIVSVIPRKSQAQIRIAGTVGKDQHFHAVPTTSGNKNAVARTAIKMPAAKLGHYLPGVDNCLSCCQQAAGWQPVPRSQSRKFLKFIATPKSRPRTN